MLTPTVFCPIHRGMSTARINDRFVAASGRAAWYMGQVGDHASASRFWRRGWSAMIVAAEHGKEAGRALLARCSRIDAAVDGSFGAGGGAL